jgi:AmmeMemoRadiSam system protein B/AmmeMemoRadiSam system protein A
MTSAVLAVALVAAACVRSSAAPAPTSEVREPAVAGRFYPGAAAPLREAIAAFLKDAPPPAGSRPLALVVPHAGYAFSGEIAAAGWRYASGRAPDLVVILGTNHTTPGLRGVAVSPARGFRTPLGVAEIDREVAELVVRADRDVVVDGEPHAREHSIEVQVPFVQVLFPRARILPLVVGSPDPEICDRLGAVLAKVLEGRNALVVASSDLSHYPGAADAAQVDRRVLAAIASLDGDRLRSTVAVEMSRGVPGLATCACGEAPVLAAMAAARAMGARHGTVIRYASSGDVPLGERQRVVGYGAVAFEAGPGPGAGGEASAPPPPKVVDAATRAALLAHARETLERWFETGTVPTSARLPPAAAVERGAFVTLTKHGALRGCIGQILPDGPVGATVGRMVLAAALKDPRFPAVTRDELPSLHIEISVLTPLRRVGVGELVAGRDGVVLAKDGRRAVFLPQVATEQGWSRTELLDHLCEKAGLAFGCWREDATLEAFQAEVFGEARRP